MSSAHNKGVGDIADAIGAMDGRREGVALGNVLGSKLGVELGFRLGCSVVSMAGRPAGGRTPMPFWLGRLLGSRLGPADGLTVGGADGVTLGLALGEEDGLALGEALGLVDGSMLGVTLGNEISGSTITGSSTGGSVPMPAVVGSKLG